MDGAFLTLSGTAIAASLCLAAACGQAADDKPLTIVALGSSTTAKRSGVRSVYVDRLQEELPKRGIPVKMINSGVGGDTTDRARKRFDKDVLAHNPDLVIIQLGINDSAFDVWKDPAATKPRVPMDRYEENLRTFVRTLKERGAEVILMTPNSLRWTPKLKELYGKPPYKADDVKGFAVTVKPYAEVVRKVAREEGAELVDVFKAFESYCDGKRVDRLLLDGMHPNDQGHHIVADLLIDKIMAMRGPKKGSLPEPKAPTTVFVDKGKPVDVRTVGQEWRRGDGYIECSGMNNYLYAGRGVGEGPFRIKARLRMEKQRGSAACFVIGRSYFGFDGGHAGEIFVTGTLFSGHKKLGPSTDVFPRGSWIDFQVTRGDGRIEFAINGKVLRTVYGHGESFPRIGFTPHRSTMQISDLSIIGRTKEMTPPKPRGYSIPLIDLTDQDERRIIIDKEPDQYLGHPTTVLLEDNKTMVCVYPKGHGKGAIVMKRSTDGGLTWGERLPVPENWATSKEVPTIYRVVDPKGVKRLIMFSGLYPIRMAVSEDDGKTWTPLEPIGDFGGIVAMSDLVRLKDGSYMALFHDDGRFLRKERRKMPFQVFKSLSADGGLTWSEPEKIAEHPHAHLCEPGAVRSPDGKQIAVLLRENSRQYNSFVIFSDDEGKTWSEPVELPAALTGDRHQGIYAPDGRLVFTFRDTTHVTPTKGDFVAWVGTYDDIVHGREGQYRVRLLDNKKGADCGYPGMELLPDGTIVATTYCHLVEGEPPLIASVRFKLDELDEMAKQK